jgi:hypothetical protein
MRNPMPSQIVCFFSLAPEESFQPTSEEDEYPETLKRVIEELKQSREPLAKQLIGELQEN